MMATRYVPGLTALSLPERISAARAAILAADEAIGDGLVAARSALIADPRRSNRMTMDALTSLVGRLLDVETATASGSYAVFLNGKRLPPDGRFSLSLTTTGTVARIDCLTWERWAPARSLDNRFIGLQGKG